MEHIIDSVLKTYNLYKQPHNIGDLLEVQGKQWIIIAIESIAIRFDKIHVIYTIQNAEDSYVIPPRLENKGETEEAEIRIQTGKEPVIEKIQPGRLVYIAGEPYQSIGFTDIKIDFTDIIIGFECRLLHPIPMKEVRAIVREEKRKKLKLEIL